MAATPIRCPCCSTRLRIIGETVRGTVRVRLAEVEEQDGTAGTSYLHVDSTDGQRVLAGKSWSDYTDRNGDRRKGDRREQSRPGDDRRQHERRTGIEVREISVEEYERERG